MLHFMYWRLRIRMWCTLFHFDSCPEKKLVNNCLDIDHSCSHLPAVNPAIFQGVTFNNFSISLSVRPRNSCSNVVSGRKVGTATVSRKTAHPRISFSYRCRFSTRKTLDWVSARAAHATYIVGTVRSSGHSRSPGRTRSSGRTHILYRYIQARAWQYKFHHLTYLREARYATSPAHCTFFNDA